MEFLPVYTQQRAVTSYTQRTVNTNLLNRFLLFLDSSEKTKETYTRAIRQLLKYLINNGITRPTRLDILSFKEHLKNTGKKPTTIQNYITAIKIFFTWASQEKIYDNIADHIKGAKISKEHKKDYLTSEQVKEILSNIDKSTIKGQRDYCIMLLMITGGLRDIEITRANTEDIRPMGDKTVLYLQGKGRQERQDYIILSIPVQKELNKYLQARAGDQVPLFTSISNNNHGQRMTTRAISGLVKNRLQEAGFSSERLTAHSLRHTAITLALLDGQEITQVQQFARHSNINTTMIYNHAIDKAKNTCSESITNSIF